MIDASRMQRKASRGCQNLAQFKAGLSFVADGLLRRHGYTKEEVADCIEFKTVEDYIIDGGLENLLPDIDVDEFVHGAQKHCAEVAGRIRKGQKLNVFGSQWRTVLKKFEAEDILETQFVDVKTQLVDLNIKLAYFLVEQSKQTQLADFLVEQSKQIPELADDVEALVEILIEVALKQLPPDPDANVNKLRSVQRKYWAEIVARMRAAGRLNEQLRQ